MEKQRWEEQKREDQRKSEKKEDAGARKGSKVAKQCVVFPMICGSGGSKSRLAQAAGAEPCGQMRDEQLHAVVARSTFPSQNAQSTPCSDHFWKLRCRKSVCRCAAKQISKSKCTKHTGSEHFWTFWCCFAWPAQGIVHLVKSEQNLEGFLAFPKMMAGVGRLKRIWKDAFSVAGAVQETCSSEMLGGQGADFLRGAAFWSIRSSVLGRWFFVKGACSTLYGLASLFPGTRNTSETWTGKIAKRIGTRPSALHSTFHYWRKSRRIASFLMLPASNIDKVSQNCIVFDVANWKNEEVSQNCFLFDLTKFKSWGSLAELLRFQACRFEIDRQTDR